MTDPLYKKKLIEVALPLDVINAESAREKSIRHGHPSTLHLWWARRPLAACRAVLFAQLVDDPSAHPERFTTEAEQDAERERLFRIIEDLVKWENSTNEEVLEAARAEIVRSCDGNPPPVLDPFAGGGSIPLEAQRLGIEAYASDLNPVAVLINKALIEIPPHWANKPPVHPIAEIRTQWKGAEGLAEDVRKYGRSMRDEAERQIGHLYPKATLPDGSTADVIAWLWARTVTCSNPACRAKMPLVRSFWLGKKKGKETWVLPVIDGKTVRFEIAYGEAGPDFDGTVTRSGATCLCCSESVPLAHIRAEGLAGRIGSQLMAIAAQGNRRRVYLPAEAVHVDAADVPHPDGALATELPAQALGFRVQAYGMTKHSDLFTNRQLTALVCLSDLVSETQNEVKRDALVAGLSEDSADFYAKSIATYLACGLGKVADYSSSLCTWAPHAKQEAVAHVFTRHSISMVWDFAEAYVFGRTAGSVVEAFEWVARVLERLRPAALGHATQGDARVATVQAVLATDPPYYDNIGYADLSDFFYGWTRRSLGDVWPDLFATMTVPKASELIADPARHNGSQSRAESYFEEGFIEVFGNSRRTSRTDFPITLFYAFKQSETDHDGLGSTGWSTMLEGLISAGWSVTATWPMRTELGNR
ncbi:MAG: DUF1156 domain-containing protein, partial [Polyangiales bacterium]